MAAHALATWYVHGIGVRKNFAEAVSLESIAARAGITDAISNLAYAFESGKGVMKDETEALRLYRRAARLGDIKAMHEVGRCLYYGVGTRQNERLGKAWVRRARDAAERQKAARVRDRPRNVSARGRD